MRLGPDDHLAPVLDLLRRAFAPMDARIDPPSSLTRMTPASLAQEARENELWIIPGPTACVILTPATDHLYIGKLAVAESARGTGLARRLIGLARDRAAAHGLPTLRLQTRVELSENHATFRRLGFVQTGRTAHPGHDRPTSVTFERPV
ncbi:acetyltransferase, GNAT family protein [Pseudooceanicola batsensis HTCC2597]|uniref:Acetyltransferase, GNAT family protein n=2 Tax=Pseudooceanicola batsensis TaxID=314255 RepID=A3TVI7_PSEBH|nr:acetyltransferase, GNAT family protein [Pseudooceanicola batsensis HTCC2597]